jgi:predicted nucleic acid-binding protein
VTRPVAVLDANVLYGIVPTDLLITLAIQGIYRPHWTDTILDEAIRNITTNRPDLNPTDIARRFELMNRTLPSANVPPAADSVIAAMTNDPGDRHVLATAVTVGAEVIVTENVRHFTAPACAPHGIVAMTLDDFINELVDDHESVIVNAISEMASRRQRPPTSPAELREILAHYIPDSINRLRQ